MMPMMTGLKRDDALAGGAGVGLAFFLPIAAHCIVFATVPASDYSRGTGDARIPGVGRGVRDLGAPPTSPSASPWRRSRPFWLGGRLGLRAPRPRRERAGCCRHPDDRRWCFPVDSAL